MHWAVRAQVESTRSCAVSESAAEPTFRTRRSFEMRLPCSSRRGTPIKLWPQHGSSQDDKSDCLAGCAPMCPLLDTAYHVTATGRY